MSGPTELVPLVEVANLKIPEQDSRSSKAIEVAEKARLLYGQEVHCVAFGPGAVGLTSNTNRSEPQAHSIAFALGAGDLGCYVAISKPKPGAETRNNIRLHSSQEPGLPEEPSIFDIDLTYPIREGQDKDDHWSSYVKAIIVGLKKLGKPVNACDIYIDNTLASHGFSITSALELSLINALCAANDLELNPTEVAQLAQEAENNPLIDHKFGHQDQLALAFANPGQATLITHAQNSRGGTLAKPFEFNNKREGLFGKSFADTCFVVATCPALDNRLDKKYGASKHTVRSNELETAITILNKKPFFIRAADNPAELITLPEFVNKQGEILDILNNETSFPPMVLARMRALVTHAIYETDRAKNMAAAAERGRVKDFAASMKLGGESAVGNLDLARLDEATICYEYPVLLAILNQFAEDPSWGIHAARNLGDASRINSLLLVDKDSVPDLGSLLAEIRLDFTTDKRDEEYANFFYAIQSRVKSNYKIDITPDKLKAAIISLKDLSRLPPEQGGLTFTTVSPGPRAEVVYQKKKAD